MIDIHFNKDLPFSIFAFLHWDEQGYERLSVLVKGSFLLNEQGHLLISREKPEILLNEQFSGVPNESSLKLESDIAPFKPKTDISFNAIARSPEAKELTSWPVRIDLIGSKEMRRSYNFHVTGKRFFEPKKHGEQGQKYWSLSEMAKTNLVPLDYEHSFGGTVNISQDEVKTHPYNPVGTGLVSDYLLEQNVRVAIPQIGILAELNEPKPGVEMTVCGFVPIVKSWLPRRTLAGNLDKNWLSQRHPRMPEDFDFHYWNGAPQALQLSPYLRGDEMVRLSGLNHDPHPITLTLPGAGIGARVLRQGIEQVQAVQLQLDTFHGDVTSENLADHRFTLIWRAVIDNPADIAEIILHPSALPPIAARQGEDREMVAHKAGENKEANDILQNRKGRIDAGVGQTAAQAGIYANTATALASSAKPLFSILLVKGSKADFYEQDDKVFVTRPASSEIIHIGSQDFIYAQDEAKAVSDNPPNAPQKIDDIVTLYVRLMTEEVLVWRPVIAYWHGDMRFYINLQNIPAGEKWEFRPDTRIQAEWRHFNGKDYLVAVSPSNY